MRWLGLVSAVLVALLVPGVAAAAQVEVGVGRADITPPTGYYAFGWVRSDAKFQGQHTRLWARVVVLKSGSQKVALVSEDLGGVAGGMVEQAAEMNRDRGFSKENVLTSASHTHAGPTGYFNFNTYNTVFMTLRTPTDFNLVGDRDPQLYAFMVRRLALAIRRADSNRGKGAVGWGAARIENLTENRSIEAHLKDHGIDTPFGSGSAAQDPDGRLHTIDPDANVLRVDKYIGRRRVPVGIWSTFANHGTVNRFQFNVYNGDHHASANRVVESEIRRGGKVPSGQDVVGVYGNTDEGDQSSGLNRFGPAAADFVGRAEARVFLSAWRAAGRGMKRSTELASRWTRMCFCGQPTADGPTADSPVLGLAQFTGSEEGRGPLYDTTRVAFEGQHLPAAAGPQGTKIGAPLPSDGPSGVPLLAIRVGDRMIVSIPGEMTAEMGRRLRSAVLSASGPGVATAIISGLANEYASYFTTPQEYDQQHYEGAATAYGRTSSVALQEALVQLAGALAGNRAAPAPYAFDSTNGVRPDGAPFSTGARSATVAEQPRAAAPLGNAVFSWRGGQRGFDRPLDRAFVTVQRRVTIRVPVRTRPRRRSGGRRSGPTFTGRAVVARTRTVRRWRTVDSDLGLQIIWTVDPDGRYTARWELPLGAKPGTHRFVVTGNNYRLESGTFTVTPAASFTVERVASGPGTVAVDLHYPAAVSRQQVGDPPGDIAADLAYRPPVAQSGTARFVVNGRAVEVRASGARFQVAVPAGATVDLPRGAVRDRYGNANGNALRFSG